MTILESSARRKVGSFQKRKVSFFATVKEGVLTSDSPPLRTPLGPISAASAWGTQKRCSGGEPLATLCRFDRPWNQTPDLSHRQPVHLATELTTGTGPKIGPKTCRIDIAKCLSSKPTCWFGQLIIMTTQAQHLPAMQPFFSKNAFRAERLSCPATAVENNRFMTSQHDSCFDNAH